MGVAFRISHISFTINELNDFRQRNISKNAAKKMQSRLALVEKSSNFAPKLLS